MRLVPDNPMSRVLSVLLLFEAVVFGLAIPGLIVVIGVPALWASALGVGGIALALTASGLLRRTVGHVLGWLTQAYALAMGFVTIDMVVMGVVFGALYTVTFVLGRRLESR